MNVFLFLFLTVTTMLSAETPSKDIFTTEFQVRVSGEKGISNTIDKFDLDIRKCNVIKHKIYDVADGSLQKNGIVIRYRDKGKSADMCVKVRLEYNSDNLAVLSKYFADEKIKKEINRYYDGGDKYSAQLELTFKDSVKKDELGLKETDSLDKGQVWSMFSRILREIEVADPDRIYNDPALSAIKEKLDLVTKKAMEKPQVIRVFARCKWKVKDWDNYDEVNVEYNVEKGIDPFIEISTRVQGDIVSRDFFNKLKEKDII